MEDWLRLLAMGLKSSSLRLHTDYWEWELFALCFRVSLSRLLTVEGASQPRDDRANYLERCCWYNTIGTIPRSDIQFHMPDPGVAYSLFTDSTRG